MGQSIKYFTLTALLFTAGCSREGVQYPATMDLLGYVELESSYLQVEELVTGLEVPWDIAMGPEGHLWYTEQKGKVYRLDLSNMETTEVLELEDIHHVKSRGLLGMAIHPQLNSHPYVYLHYNFSVSRPNRLEDIYSRVVRYTFRQDTLADPIILIDSIPGNTYHNGSRLVISPDLKLFFSFGDIGDPQRSQDMNFPGGKIWRLNLDGTIPDDNPFSNSYYWSSGFRNPQGLVFASDGNLYASDHGPHNDDEINLVRKGGNYGWPQVQGFADLETEMIYAKDSSVREPLKSWTPTIAVSGLAYYGSDAIAEWKHSLLAVSLKGQALRVLKLNPEGTGVMEERVYFHKVFGRLRDVCVTPVGEVLLATSNRDWHPRLQPWLYDSLPDGLDRIIRIAPEDGTPQKQLLAASNIWRRDTLPITLQSENWDFETDDKKLTSGERLYTVHCASCHRDDGQGAPGLTPPLAATDWVTGDKTRLIRVLLEGLSEPIEVNGEWYQQEMPSYAHLDDESLALILTYIRKSFGNQAGVVIDGEVYVERKALGMTAAGIP